MYRLQSKSIGGMGGGVGRVRYSIGRVRCSIVCYSRAKTQISILLTYTVYLHMHVSSRY